MNTNEALTIRFASNPLNKLQTKLREKPWRKEIIEIYISSLAKVIKCPYFINASSTCNIT